MSQTINYDGKMFQAVGIGADGAAPIARYHQQGDLVWAEFAGGHVRRGSLTGVCGQDGVLEFAYCMLDEGVLVAGHCTSTPERLDDGRIRLREAWQRFIPRAQAGVSCLEEVPS
jgi:hypothetical protein